MTIYQVSIVDNNTGEIIGMYVPGATPPDEGVMIELGIAIALSKKIFLFRDDFRRCTDSDDYPLNLMLFAGLPASSWEDYFYTSVKEISNEKKALYRWLRP